MCVYVRNSMEFYNATVECTRVDDDELADCMVQHTVTVCSLKTRHTTLVSYIVSLCVLFVYLCVCSFYSTEHIRLCSLLFFTV